MASKIRFVAFLFVFVLSMSAANQAAAFSFQEWCGRTTKSAVCEYIIRNDPRANLKNDPSGLCTILGDKAKSFADATYQRINDALSHATDPAQKQELGHCRDAYDEGIAILRPLDFSELNHGKFQFLNLSLQKEQQVPAECRAPMFNAAGQFLLDLVTATKDILNLNECNKTAC